MASDIQDAPVGEAPLPVDVMLDRRLPVSDQIYDSLRRAILHVDLKPGAALSENRLCRHFGVSRTPVRTAIVRLVEEGMIDVYPQQGSFVSMIRLSDIVDSHFVRKSLEIAILREAAAHWTPASRDKLRQILDVQATAIAAGENEEFLAEDDAFHRAFSELAGRPGVWQTILGAKAQLGRFIRLSAMPERLPRVLVEHAEIIDALDAGDVERAIERMSHHLDQNFVMMRQLPERYRPFVIE